MRRIAVLLLLAAPLAACGSDDAAAPQTTSTTTATDVFPDELIGEYEREVTPADIERTQDRRVEGPGHEPPAPGLHRMVVNEGVMQIYLPDGFEISQELTITGDAWNTGPYVGGEGVFCPDDGPASYTWERDREGLVLTVLDDPCADRDSTLTGTWTKAG